MVSVAAHADPWWLESSQPPHPPTQQQTATEDAAKDTGKEDGETIWQRTISDPLALYTFVLTLFTGVLGASTILLWRENKRSVDAIIAADRPRLRLSKLQFGRAGNADPLDNAKYATVTIGFTNYGDKSAVVTEVCFDHLFAAMVPKRPVYRNKKTYLSLPVTIAPDSEHVFPPEIIYDDGNRQLEEVQHSLDGPESLSNLRFWVFGYIVYIDHLGKEHRTGYLGDWNFDGGGYGRYPDEAVLRGETFRVFSGDKRYAYNT
ncbi:hypothetical protein [Mesorhizobium sp. B2-8-5]|uniref:hypothetical protein n=1 Tax=Mesorhizobium sp. B2-8-5 TaxID=2589903 RepID=UPI00112BD8FB|nr:hypothetical protein [Mesorhizobium sp. B2-8-5]UCI24446.1 hypothetical protein FJ430_23015 [Mesorhizobium sp. B2-8-5]